MGRNCLIHTLADYAVVGASEVEKGGTWASSTKPLKAEWVPVFILEYNDMPEGNRAFLNKGGIAFPYVFPDEFKQLPAWQEPQAGQIKPKPIQPKLFQNVPPFEIVMRSEV